MGWQEFVGYVGSFLMFSTFWMKTMIRLRIAGLAGNVAMTAYAAMAGLWPMMILQLLMFPVNVGRLVQIRRLVRRVAEMSGGEFRPDALIPFMQREVHEDGHVLFRAGDRSDRMYLIREGGVRLLEVSHTLGPNDLFGEIGLVSAENRRTATAVCEGRTVLMSIDQDHVLQLYHQEPEFGFYLIRLVTDRLLRNLEARPAEQA
ncbi:MAG TPA: cyclic nucleotide-binding domain-containing protein [Kofleriaceae bacterium]|nr:cyclic nucleotide-binding domain-containing protein [Kofleriaceae bacterium]